MPLMIDNAQFNQFVQFAEQQMQAGKATAKAQVGDAAQDNPLAGRTIVAKSGDFVGNIGRFKASRDVNNDARTLFRNAISDMFGGENRIPPSVKAAMRLQNYGGGSVLKAALGSVACGRQLDAHPAQHVGRIAGLRPRRLVEVHVRVDDVELAVRRDVEVPVVQIGDRILRSGDLESAVPSKPSDAFFGDPERPREPRPCAPIAKRALRSGDVWRKEPLAREEREAVHVASVAAEPVHARRRRLAEEGVQKREFV